MQLLYFFIFFYFQIADTDYFCYNTMMKNNVIRKV